MSIITNAMSGLNAANMAMAVTGQNVANAAVDGYSRQTAYLATSGAALGGVYVTSVDRIVDAFLNDDIWRTNSDLSLYQGKQTYLGYVEEIVGTDSLNFNDALTRISNAFNAAASTPDSQAYRQQIISSSQAMLQDLSQMNGALSGQLDKLSLEMSNLALNTSSTAEQIAELNHSINQAVANNQPTAQLKDKREQLIKTLSGQIGIAVTDRNDGSLDISTLTGAPLVMGTRAAQVTSNGTTVSTQFAGQSFQLTDKVGGRFGGLISADTEVIKPTLQSLNTLVKDFADDINAALSQGFDLNAEPGIDLFTYNAANPLATMAINPDITPDKLALAGGEFDTNGDWVVSGGVGDNANIANIINAIADKGDAFSVLVGDLGIASKQNQNSATTSEVLHNNSVLARDSRSGVNLDEEAANLMHFQQMYSANAKVITTADQVFNTLLTMF